MKYLLYGFLILFVLAVVIAMVKWMVVNFLETLELAALIAGFFLNRKKKNKQFLLLSVTGAVSDIQLASVPRST